MAFFSGNVMEDAAEYASRLSGFIRRKAFPGYAPLPAALDDLAMCAAREQIHRLDEEFEALSDDAVLPVTDGRRATFAARANGVHWLARHIAPAMPCVRV